MLPIVPYFSADEALWKLLHKKYPGILSKSCDFWYLSAGFDLEPLLRFNCRQHPLLRRPQAYMYTDYGFSWKGIVQFRKTLKHQSSLNMQDDFSSLALEAAVPLRLFHEPRRNTLIKQYSHSGASPLPAPFDLALLLFRCRKASRTIIPLWYAVMDNLLFLNEIARPNKMHFSVICTVTDGCREGGNPSCPNDQFDAYATTLQARGYWLTDHYNTGQPGALTKVDEIEAWGHYALNDKTGIYQYNPEKSQTTGSRD